MLCRSCIYRVVQQFRLEGTSGECLVQTLLSCGGCGGCEGMAAISQLSGRHVASCLLIFCCCRLRFLQQSIHFCFSIIFALLESYLRNIPKNKIFQAHAFSFLQASKITYICIWHLLGKCLPSIIKNFAFCQITYSCKILVFQILFLYRPEAKFG